MNYRYLRMIAILFFILFVFSCAKEDAGTPDSTEGKSPENTAVLVFSVGKVMVSQTAVWKDAEINMILRSGDAIETGARSKCNIVIGKDSYISVKENSKFVLQNLSFNSDGTENTTVELKVGKGVINPKKLMKNDSFTVKTPTSVAAVRGTKFSVETNPGEVTKVSVLEGKVQLSKRIPALENTENAEDTKDISEMLNKKIEKESIIISENQSGEIDNIKVEQLNLAVAEVIKVAKKENEPVELNNEPVVDAEKKLSDRLADLDKTIQTDVAIQKTDMVNVDEKEEILELDEYVQENKVDIEKAVETAEKIKVTEAEKQPEQQPEKIIEKSLPKGMALFVSSPEKSSHIYFDGRLKGIGSAEYVLKENEKVTITVKTKGYNDYIKEILWEDTEKKTINSVLVNKKLLDRIAWKIDFPGGLKGSVVDYGRKSILTSSTGRISCVDTYGQAVWNTTLDGGIDSIPALGKDRIFVVTKDGKLYSLDARNGKTVFDIQLDGTLLFNSSPIVTEKELFIGTSTGKVYKIDFSGKIKWMQNLNVDIYSTPVFDGSNIYIGTDSKYFYAMDAGNGKIEWKTQLDSRVVSTAPVIFKNTVVICTYSGTMYILDKNKGKVKQNLELKNPVTVTPVINRNNAVLATSNGTVYSIDLQSAKINWQKKLAGSVVNTPTLAGNSLFLTSGNTVYDLNADTGSTNWSYNLGETVRTTISFSGNSLLMGTEKGSLFSLRKDLRDITE